MSIESKRPYLLMDFQFRRVEGRHIRFRANGVNAPCNLKLAGERKFEDFGGPGALNPGVFYIQN
mgnify:CR=1 FL=1